METDSTEITQDILGREQETSKVRFKIKGKLLPSIGERRNSSFIKRVGRH